MELLIRTIDKHVVVNTLHETSSQRGDVIAACPDGWVWSAAEEENPDWIIIGADITEVEALALLEPYREGEPKYRRRLGVSVDGLLPKERLTREQLTGRVF